MNKMRNRIVATLLIVALAGALFARQWFYIVDERNQAILLQFGEPVATIREPGLATKLPFIQNVIYFEKRVLSSDGSPQEYLTRDKKRLVVDHVTRWRIDDPLLFYKAVRTESGARARLDDIVFSELRRELATVDFAAVISDQRDPIMERVAASSAVNAAEFGIDLVDVRVKRADLPTEVEQSVFNRMRAERQRDSALFRAEGEEQANIIRAQADRASTVILAEGYREAQGMRGDGEAAAIRIYADALSQDLAFYSFSRRLESYSEILKPGDRVILAANADFFDHLLNNKLPGDLAATTAPLTE
jgi:membrane protease subunit HflC